MSSAAVAGSSGGSIVNRLTQNPATGDLYAAGSLANGAGNGDIWVARYSPELVLLSSYTYDKAGFGDVALGVAVDTATSDVFAAGFVSSASASSSRDIWLARFNSSLVLQASVTVNGSASDRDEATMVRVSSGSLYVVGISSQTGGKGYWLARYDANLVLLSSTNFYQHNTEVWDFLQSGDGIFVTGSRAPNLATSNDVWIGKFSTSLVFVTSAAYNGPASQSDEIHGLAEDGAGGVYAVGFVYTGTMADQYLVHYDSNLVRTASATLNGAGSNNDTLYGLVRTASGSLLVSGSYTAAAGLGGVNAYLAEYDTSLTRLSSTSFTTSGTASDQALAVLVGLNQDVYAAGYATNAGSQDIWLARFSTTAAPSVPAGLAASGVGLGAATLSWTAGAVPGAVYELERSTGTGFGLRQSSAALFFVDAALSAASTYYYRVRAVGDLWASAYSSTIAVATPVVAVYPAVASITPSSASASAGVFASLVGTGFDVSAVLSLERRPADAGVWTATGAFTQARMLGTLTKLRDGRALLAGGQLEGLAPGLTAADIFNPATGAWTPTAPLLQGRNQFASVLLADGRVLAAGGTGPAGTATATAEIYDPTTSSWTAAASMANARIGLQMTLLADGRVLAAGGWNGTLNPAAAEIYDPATNAWSLGGALAAGRMFPVMIMLRTGKVLIAGDSGAAAATAELYDPAVNSWAATGSPADGGAEAQAVMLPDGRVLVAGGRTGTVKDTASVYDPATGLWTATSTMAAARFEHGLVSVGGVPLALGGSGASLALSSTEIYDAALNAWRAGPSLNAVRYNASALVLDDGKVLVAGGRTGGAGSPNANTAEVLVAPSTRITATGTSSPDAQHVSGTVNLAGAATGYWDVVVAQSGGRVARLSGGFQAFLYPPLAPTGFAGVAQSSTSILWSWTDISSDEAGFRVMSGAVSVSGDLAAGATTWLQSGLGVNAGSGALFARAFNAAGAADSGSATRYSLAAVPSALGASSVFRTSATVTWTGANPPGTFFALERSTGGAFAAVSSMTSGSYLDGGLAAASTYYYRVRAYNSDGIASAYASTIAVVTLPYPAEPVLVSIAVTPSAATIPTSSSTLFTAIGTYADGSTRTLNGTWRSRAPLNESRTAAAGAFSGGKLYVFGGGNAPGTPFGSYTSEAYDPTIDSWTYRASSPVRRGYASAAENAGKIYVVGGCVDLNCTFPNALVYEYDTVLDSWASKASLPGAIFETALEQIGGKLYAAGGIMAGYISTSALREYDPAANTWTTKAPMPYARGYAASGVIDGKLYVAGGRINNDPATGNELQIYDPVANAWSLGAPMPSARFTAGGAVVNGRLYVVGGDHDQIATNSTDAARVQIYDAASNTWTEGPALQVSRYSPTMGVHLGKLYAAAAAFGNVATAAVEVLNPDEAVWSSGAPAVAGVSAGGSATGLTPGSASITASSGAVSASAALTVVGLPGAPTGFSGTAQSTAAILWSWADSSSNETGFRVMSGTASLSGDAAAGSSMWLQTGLAMNTAYGPYSAAAFNSSGTAASGSASRWTLAGVPGTPAASGVQQTSATLSWSAGGNPGAPVFELERSTGAGFALRFTGPATAYFDATLTPGVTHFYRVRALNGDGIATAYSATATVVAAPPPLPDGAGAPVGTALGTSSAAWTWTPAPGADSHLLFRAADGASLGSVSTGAFTQTGLAPNTAYGLRVAGVNLGGAGALSAAATVYTMAAAPTGGAAASITSTTLTASWALGANPPATLAELERSVDAILYSTLAVAAATSYADADLLGCTTYYYRVRNLNGDGLATAYASFQGLTANTIPAPPSGLSASANAGGTISLSWGFSPTEGVTGYRLYWDAGAGAVSYGAPLAVLGSTQTSFTTGVLASSAAYTFALRAVHRCGVVETAGASAMSGAAVAAAAVRAAIKEPDSGRRVNGNRVTILGELIAGAPEDVSQVLFQYKLDTSSAWIDVDEANLNHPNPDFSFPYFVHVDVTALAPGAYDLRAVAYDRDGAPDPAPPAVRVVVDPITPDISETRLVDGTIKKAQTISNAVTSVVDTAGAGAADPAVRVTIPVGAVNSTTATVSVIANPAITTAAPSGQTLVGSSIKIDLSNGQSALNGTAEITLTYPDTVLFPSLLQIYYLDETTGRWSRDFASTVDTASRTVTGRTPHFSTFAIMLGTSFAADLSAVRVYPVPFKPNGANADEGRPFSIGDANSGIIFSNLAAGSEIRIYTLTGRLVASLDSPSIAGAVRWDARNQDGRDVASGAYFAVISAAGQKNAVKKLVIIR